MRLPPQTPLHLGVQRNVSLFHRMDAAFFLRWPAMQHPTISCATSRMPSVGSRFTSWTLFLVLAASWPNLPTKTISILPSLLAAFTGVGTLFRQLLYCCALMVTKQRNLLPMENCRYGARTDAGFHTFSAAGDSRIGRSTGMLQLSMLMHRGKAG